MIEEIKGEKSKEKLIQEIQNSIEINGESSKSIKRQKESVKYKYSKDSVDDWAKGVQKRIDNNCILIDLMKNQLQRDFGYIYR